MILDLIHITVDNLCMHALGLNVRDASTVILVSPNIPFEVYLMQRATNQEFMGGAYVFPGGQVDHMDTDPGLLEYCCDFTPARAKDLLQEARLEDSMAMGLFFAAIRELFEEAGILLAYTCDHTPVDFHDTGKRQRFTSYRAMLHRHEITLLELADIEDINYAPLLLTPYSRWITPKIEGKRFDTRFFLAHAPLMQVASEDNQELVRSRWMTPLMALSEHMQKRIVLMPPTLMTMQELSAYSSSEDLFKAARDRCIMPILPEPFVSGTQIGLRLPHDPDYSIEMYKQAPRYDEPSRIVMEDGVWKTI